MIPKEYLFSFEPLAGYRMIGDVTYSYWLSIQPGHIYVLRRE